MNSWERWTVGERLVVVLFATGLLAFVIATAIRSIPSRPADVKIYDAPQPAVATPQSSVASPIQTGAASPALTPQKPTGQSEVAPPATQPAAAASQPSGQSAAAAPSSPPAVPVQTPGAGPVNLNTADVTQLDTLPGIGPVLAQRIVEYRQKAGRFTSVEQLLEVRGIGPKKLEKIRPLVTL